MTLSNRTKRAISSIWFFPAVLSLILILLVALNINGSSIGVYHNVLYGNNVPNDSLIYGQPRSIRSDEWLGWSQNAAGQSRMGYPAFNTNLGNDGDLSKNAEIPVGGWVAVFRPHNWGFFILPFEHAFAFKWWFILFALVVSGYFFILRLLPGNKTLAVILSVGFAVSPFIMWWYQSILFMSLAYAFMILIISSRVLKQEAIPKIRSPLLTNSIYTVLLIFLGTSLGLTLYPPYALPIFIVVMFFVVGSIINMLVDGHPKVRVLKRLVPFAIAAVGVIAIAIAYVLSHSDMIERTAGSLYPGARRVISGDLPLIAILDGYLMPLLQSNHRALNYYANQSEASNFILLLPFLLVPAILIQVIDFIKNHRINWIFAAINLCSAFFLMRALVPVDTPFYHALFLDRVPNVRLKSGIGFVGFIQLLFIIKSIPVLRLSKKHLLMFSLIAGIASAIILILVTMHVINTYPGFIDNYLVGAVLGTFFIAIIVSFLAGYPTIGSLLLLAFSLGSSFKIMPLNQGLDFIQDGRLVQKIQEVSRPSDRWITTDDLYYSNLPFVAGRPLLSGSQNYPDPQLWSQIAGEKYEKVYNRQARTIYITDSNMEEKMKLIAPNYFVLKFECSDFIYRNVDYVLAVNHINAACLNLVDTVEYPKKTFYIYSVNQQS